MKRFIKRIFKIIAIILIFILISIVFLNQLINWRSGKYLYDSIEELPENNVALVLGTSRFKRDGSSNPYFHNRINAAVQLYENNKVNYILVSGDNRSIYYNEPSFMRLELIKNNIPDSIIYMDYAGFRTFDSVIRCHKVFGQDSFTIVSQKFHNQRAVFIALSNNIEVVGFNALDIKAKDGLKVRVREIFARIKMFTDIISDKQPKFLGEPVEISSQ